MSPEQVLDLVNFAMLVMFVFGIALAMAKLLDRAVEYRRANWQQPRLLRRDLVFIGGLAISFGLILLRRLFQIDIVDTLLWNIITGVPAIFGLYYWVWEEYRTVGKEDGVEIVEPNPGEEQ